MWRSEILLEQEIFFFELVLNIRNEKVVQYVLINCSILLVVFRKHNWPTPAAETQPQTRTDCDNFTLCLRQVLWKRSQGCLHTLQPWSSKDKQNRNSSLKTTFFHRSSPPMMSSGSIQIFLLLLGVEEWLGQRNPALVSKGMESIESSGLGNLGTTLIPQLADLVGARKLVWVMIVFSTLLSRLAVFIFLPQFFQLDCFLPRFWTQQTGNIQFDIFMGHRAVPQGFDGSNVTSRNVFHSTHLQTNDLEARFFPFMPILLTFNFVDCW